MRNYVDKWEKTYHEKRYHFENVYNPVLPLSKVDLFQAGELIVGDGHVIDYHEQACSEISYVVSGCCDFYADDKVFHAKQGDIHVVRKGMRHKIVVGENEMLRMAYIGFCFRESGEALDKMMQFYSNPPQVLCNDRHLSRTLFEQLLYEIYVKQSYSLDAVEACVTQILIHVYRIFQQGGEIENHRIVEEARLKQIIGHTVFKTLRYIDNNISSVSGVSQIAEELKYSPAYLSRIFREKTGVTLHHYIEEKKVEMGKELLRGGMSVSETALRLGYASSQSFCKMFSRCNGCSPTVYLKREKEGGQASVQENRVDAEEL